MRIPTKEECFKILHNNNTPSHIIEHCKTVCKVAERIASNLIKKGIGFNKDLVIAGALLHDVERGKSRHVARGISLLRKLGYPEVAKVIKKHSLYKLEAKSNQPKTWEEKIVFYADKRCIGNKIVSMKKRFSELERHYKTNLGKELIIAGKIEKELLGK